MDLLPGRAALGWRMADVVRGFGASITPLGLSIAAHERIGPRQLATCT